MKQYEQYKDSGVDWIGEIPKHWEVMRMRFLCDMITGDKDTVNRVKDGMYPFYVRSPKVERINSYTYDGEAVLMAGDGVGAGKVLHYVNGKFDFHQRVYNFHNFRIITGFLLYLYLQSNFKFKIEEGGAKNTVDSVRQPWLKDFPVCIPPYSEQVAITGYLSTKASQIDAQQRERERELRLLDELRQAEISRVVTRGLNPDVKLKDSGIPWIGEIPEHWEICKVKHHYNLQTGFTPDTKKNSYYDAVNGFDWVNIGDIKGRTIYSTENKISQQYIDDANPLIVPAGSLLYSFKLSVGQVAFAGKDIYTNEAIASFLDGENVYLPFLYYSAQYYIIHNANTNIYGAKILNQDLIKNAIIVFPPLEEQIVIANYLDSQSLLIDEEMEKCRRQIELLKELKQSLISQVVTGKIKVTE